MSFRSNVTRVAIVGALVSCERPRSHESVLFISLCQIAQYSESLAEVDVGGWGTAQQIDLTGNMPGEVYYTPIIVNVRNVLWGALKPGTYTVLVQGDIDESGRSLLAQGTYRVDGQPTMGLMFFLTRDNRLVQSAQGYFWRTGDVLRNDARYRGGIEREELIRAQAFSGLDSCPRPPEPPPPDAAISKPESDTVPAQQ
jgi:hypothetical protein